MPWLRIEERFPDHPKVAALDELEAVCGWLDLKAKCWSNSNLTDGRVSGSQVRRLASTFLGRGPIDPSVTADMLTARLVEVGLWERDGTGFRVHDFLSYNPSREDVLAVREVRAAIGRVGGQHSGEARRRARDEANEAKREANAKQTGSKPGSKSASNGEAKPNPVPVPVPVPVPTELETQEASESARAREPTSYPSPIPWGDSPAGRAPIPPLPSDPLAIVTPELADAARVGGCRDLGTCIPHWHAKRMAKAADRRTWCSDWRRDLLGWLLEHGRYGGPCQERAATGEVGKQQRTIAALQQFVKGGTS